MSRDLPARPSIEFLKKEAKELLDAMERGDAAALERFLALAHRPPGAAPHLADAQHVLAREYGFAGWAELKAHVKSRARPLRPAEALAAAVRADDTRRVGQVLERYPELKAQLDQPMAGEAFGATPLLAAVQRSSREMIDLLLQAGADINARSHWWAGSFGVLDDDYGLAPFLIERGAVVDVHAAARLGMRDRLEAMLAERPELVHARGGDGQTPLHFAPTVDIAALLLEHGAAIDARDIDHESTPAQYMVRSRQEVARYLVARGCRTDILMAAALGDLALVRRYLDADPASIQTTISEEYFPKQDPRSGGAIYIWTLGGHRTAHLVAREFGHEEIFSLLMDRSPDDLKLAIACELGDEPLFQRLLADRPDLARSIPERERRKLPDAARANNVRAARLMLAAGWPVDARGQHLGTALHWAAWHGNAEMVRELLRHDAPVSVQGDEWDLPPIGWALHGSLNGWHCKTGDYAGTVEALLDAGAAAPPMTDDLEGSEPVLAVLRRRGRA